ncbi:MAG: hypothetical protein ACLSSU_00930 [Beduini sp.]
MPYLYSEANFTSKTGIPIMRAMVLEFSKDYNTHTLDHQYMLGKNLLVAPIFKENGQIY